MVGGIAYLFYISWKLSVLMIVSIPVVVLAAICYGGFMRRISRKTQDACAQATDMSSEAIGSIRTVRSCAQEGRQTEAYNSAVDLAYRLGAKTALAYGCFIGLMSTIGGFTLVGLLFYGGTLVLDGEMTPGVLTSYLLYCITVSTSLGGLMGLAGNFMAAIGATERVFELLDRRAAVALEKGTVLSNFQGRVEFEDVRFCYPSRIDQPVLRGVSFCMEPGQVVALVGPSGGGKSTVVNLIERFYGACATGPRRPHSSVSPADLPLGTRVTAPSSLLLPPSLACVDLLPSLAPEPAGGRILFDGVPLTDIKPDWVHGAVGLVRQEPVLFAVTIAENIACRV